MSRKKKRSASEWGQPQENWHKPIEFHQQSKGPRYLRCPVCKRQIASRTGRQASPNQVQFDLSVALAEHRRTLHPDKKG